MRSSNQFSPLEYFTINSLRQGPHLMIIAGIHGDEFEPMLATINLRNKLDEKLKKGKITILPVANQHAYESGSRCGPDQIDLARVFPGCNEEIPTEKTAIAISHLIEQADYLIDLHTGGALFDITPLTGYFLHSNDQVLKQQQEMAKAFNLPVIWGTDASAQGRSLSVARDHNIPAIYAECRGGLSINIETIALYEQGCMNVIEYLGMLEFTSSKILKKHTWLEDYRPGEGHLQQKLPAPTEGVFLPILPLGEKVKKGALLGYIVDPLKNKQTEVIIEEDGLLFMLRISSRVRAGDSLGGILPIDIHSKKVIHAK